MRVVNFSEARSGLKGVIDQVIADAERKGIALELALQYHGAFSTVFNPAWDENPYNAANGGPLDAPGDFAGASESRSVQECASPELLCARDIP